MKQTVIGLTSAQYGNTQTKKEVLELVRAPEKMDGSRKAKCH